jgi:uncharacterized GH25 family protein
VRTLIPISLLLLLCTKVDAQSQEFWLQPRKFKIAAGEEVAINFLIGENFEGEPLDLKKNRVERLDYHHLTKAKDIKGLVKPEEKVKLNFKPDEAGTLLVSCQSIESYIELEAEKFNDYLKDEGLDYIIDQRETTNSSDKPLREFHQYYSKLILQAADKTDDTYKKKSGLTLEIIPLQNPYNLKPGDHLQCQILFENKPLPHQRVRISSILEDRSFVQSAYTENDGTVRFPISIKGPWMISTVNIVPSKKTGADWQTFSSSLTFGIE